MKSLFKNILFASSAMTLFALVGCANSSSETTSALKEGKEAAQTTEQTSQAETANGDGNQANAATDSIAKENAEKPEVEQAAAATIVRRNGKIPNRGGFIKLSVNANPITNFDLERREKFLRLRRQQGNLSEIAEQELIEQVLKLQEAVRRRTLATEEMVDGAFANFAKNNRTTPANLSQQLGGLGIGEDHFKEFIRTQISWQRTVQGRFQAETTQVTEEDAIRSLRESGSAKPELTEYSFKQVVFVVPESKRNAATLAARKVEADNFRQNYTSCDNTITLAKAFKDVSVIDRRRILEPELPLRWKDDITALAGNGITGAKETQRGIELMAVCKTRVVQDDNAAKIATQNNEFSVFNEKSNELSKNYLDELRSRATIIYQ